MAFFEDTLMTVSGGITHHGETLTVEDLSPTLENTTVVLWFQLIHPGQPLLVKPKYGPELRNKSLASLKPEISQALTSLLDELRLTKRKQCASVALNHGGIPQSSKVASSVSPFCHVFSVRLLAAHIHFMIL